MCNLNFLIKTNNQKTTIQSEYLNAYNSACLNSFISNNDNEGFFFDYKNTVLTSDSKINLYENKGLFENSNFVLGHQRYTTSGQGIDYAQPFKKNDFVFFHNGVIGEYANGGHSDTFNLFNAFLKHYTRYTKTSKHQIAIKKAIEKILKNKYGTFSIGIYDIKNQQLFYFKNDRTQINAVMDNKKDLLYLTTLNHNTDFLGVYNKDLSEYEIKDSTLYLISITKKNKISFKDIGKLSFEKKHKNTYFNEYDNEVKNAFDLERANADNLFNLDFFKSNLNIKKDSVAFKCSSCDIPTYNTSGDYGAVFCDNCLREIEDLGY